MPPYGGNYIFMVAKESLKDKAYREILEGIFSSEYKPNQILNEKEDLVLEDNYFDMNGGEKRIRILRGTPEGLKLRSVYNIGRS